MLFRSVNPLSLELYILPLQKRVKSLGPHELLPLYTTAANFVPSADEVIDDQCEESDDVLIVHVIPESVEV